MTRNARVILTLVAAFAAASAAGQDPVPIPGGPASVRRLLGIDPARPDASFFLDVNEILLFGSAEATNWSSVEPRRRTAAFAEDVAAWRLQFGEPARFTMSPPVERARVISALDWLGFSVRGAGPELETERRADATSLRRQSFLDAAGTPTADFLARLRAGESVTISIVDLPAPLPFGLDAWRVTLSAPDLTASNAFLHFVRNIRASRMLVALHGLDPETREQLHALLRNGAGRPVGWKLIYDEALEPFARYPEALEIREGRFLLPGGDPAQPIWTATFGVTPERASFLNAFFTADREKGAYVVDTLQHLREDDARKLIFGDGPDEDAVKGFRSLYKAIDPEGADFASARRDPYDFAQLAAFLASPTARSAGLPPVRAGDASWPRDEAELSAQLARGAGGNGAEESLQRLLRHGTARKTGDFSVQRRFLFLSGLAEARPNLAADPGLVLLLDRGFDRFWPAYAILQEFPFPGPELARAYLFALGRLDRPGGGRDAELSAGLFQGHVLLLARLSDAGSLDRAKAADLFAALLEVPLFAREGVTPAQGEEALFAWVAGKLLPALRGSAEEADADELVGAALGGPPAPSPVPWRGGRYRFDPVGDAAAQRRAFLETQTLAGFSDLETIHREREAALSAARSGDLEAARAASERLALALRLSAPGAAPDQDERVERAESRARDAAEKIAGISQAIDAFRIAGSIEAFDGLVAERHLEAVLGHVYSIGARDPDDLYFQDPSFVARHSFRTVELAGQTVTTAFTKTALARAPGGGFRVSGSLFGLDEVLGLLHTDQLTYRDATGVPIDEIRSGLVAPIWQMDPALLDDDALQLVAACARATLELAAALVPFSPAQRFEVWDGVARDLVPRSRLAMLSAVEAADGAAVSPYLSSSDLYRIGRRLLQQAPTSSLPLPSAQRAREALGRLEAARGKDGAARRLAQFGPSAEALTGRPGLADIDLPPYERLAVYRRPRMLAERLYDLKVSVAVRLVEAGLPAGVLPIVLPAAIDTMLASLDFAYPYDWAATTRAASAFSAADIERILDQAVEAGRLVRDTEASPSSGNAS
jgi:hypothetical protein